jgi:Spy/CpxP family protein refolding chaperone
MKREDNKMTIRCVAIFIFSAGMTWAQATPQTATTPAPGQGTTPGPRGRGPGRGPGRGLELFGPNAEARITKEFALNATQANTLHTALASAKVQQQGMREKETTLRTQLAAAVKAGSESSIESSAAEIETLHQQQTSIRAKTLSTVYSSLTAAQKVKFEALLNHELGLPGPGRGPGGGPGGRGPRTANATQPAQPAAQPQ